MVVSSSISAIRHPPQFSTFGLKKALILFGPGILLLAWFLPAFWDAGFSWDDRKVLFENPAIRDLDVWGLFRHGYWAWHGDPPMFRPLASLSLSLDLHVFGGNPLALHRSTLLLHGLSSLFLAWGVSRFQAKILPFVFLLLYLHPVASEQAFWISGRSGVLMYLFLGIGLGLGIQASRSEGRSLWWAMLFLLFAALSREDGILGFPILFFWVPRGRRLGFALASTALCLLWAGLRVFALSRFLGGGGDLLRGAGLWERLLSGADWFAHSIRMLLLWEPPRILSAGIPSTHWMRILLPLFFLAFVLAFVRRWSRELRFVLLWAFLGSLPFLRLFPLAEGLAGRYAYVLLPPLALGLGLAFIRLKRFQTWMLFTPLVLFPWTLKQWRTIAKEEQAYLQVLEVDPGDRRALSLLANALEAQGKGDEALRAYRELTERFPRYPKAWVNLGNLLFRLGRRSEGLAVLEKSCQRFPRHALAWLSLGRARFATGANKKAATAFATALKLAPRLGQAARFLCRARLKLGHWKAAAQALEQAKHIDPRHPSLVKLAEKLAITRRKEQGR